MPELIPQPGGRGALLTGGMPGNVGGGRPPDEFKRMLAHLSSRAKTIGALSKILKDPDHKMFMQALEYATDRGYPELANAVRAANVNITNVETKVTIWKFGDREVRF